MSKNPPDDDKSQDSGASSDKGKGAEAKQGVIGEGDVKSGKIVNVKVAGLRGECAGAKFNNDCVATGVNEEQLSKLRGQFGKSVEVVK